MSWAFILGERQVLRAVRKGLSGAAVVVVPCGFKFGKGSVMSDLVRGYTGPMVRQYGRFVNSSTLFLMSADGRLAIANALRFCRRRYGVVEARRFRAGLLWVGCVFPIERQRLWVRLEAV